MEGRTLAEVVKDVRITVTKTNNTASSWLVMIFQGPSTIIVEQLPMWLKQTYISNMIWVALLEQSWLMKASFFWNFVQILHKHCLSLDSTQWIHLNNSSICIKNIELMHALSFYWDTWITTPTKIIFNIRAVCSQSNMSTQGGKGGGSRPRGMSKAQEDRGGWYQSNILHALTLFWQPD